MMKKSIATLLLVLPFYSIQAQFISSLSIDDFDFSFAGQISTSYLTAPVLDNILEFEDYRLEPKQSHNAGVSFEVLLNVIEHENFSYRYSQEWSYGYGNLTSYHYRLRGHEFSVGLPHTQFVYQYKSRLLNIIGNPDNTLDRTRHRASYQNIRRNVLGLKGIFEDGSSLLLGFAIENFSDQEVDSWYGGLLRVEDPSGWGFEAEVFWNHFSDGELFFDTSQYPIAEDLERTGWFVNVKLNYRFGYRGSYADL